MALFKNKYRTESNRLKNWDYASKAIYFITLVTKNRECIFGTIEENKMLLNDNGKIIETELLKSIQIRERWHFHNWVIMPNHIHLLIEILDLPNDKSSIPDVETQNVETHCSASLQQQSQQSQLSKCNYSTKTILPNDADIELINLFISYDTYISYIESINEKSSSKDVETNKSNPNKLTRKPNSISSFVAVFKSLTTKQINRFLEKNDCDSIWQSNYHDHIVQNYDSFDKIYYYIKNNPKNWDIDSINK